MTDFEREFAAWLFRICREKPPPSVTAYNIGLFETIEGFSAYLIGADHYDAEDSDWACAERFSPSEKYFRIPADSFARWEQVHQGVVDAARAFLRSPEGRGSYLSRAEAVTVGFDDGDLERIDDVPR